MKMKACAQCGADIEGEGLVFRGRTFCGDECCEEFQDGFVDDSEPSLDELDEDDFDDDDFDDDDLGYRDDDDDFEDDDDEDDFTIDPDDF